MTARAFAAFLVALTIAICWLFGRPGVLTEPSREQTLPRHAATSEVTLHGPPEARQSALGSHAAARGWLAMWTTVFSRLDAARQWEYVDRSEFSSALEARAMKKQIGLACSVSMHSPDAKSVTPLVREWCRHLASIGRHRYEQDMRDLLQDIELAAAPFNVLGARKLDSPMDERNAERRFLEDSLRTANDPWSVASSVRSLWAHRSTLVAEDWTEVDALSRFQQSRLKMIVATHAACIAVRDCSANSVWTVSLCASIPGLVCEVGSGMDSVIAQSLSPHEQRLESAIVRTAVRNLPEN